MPKRSLSHHQKTVCDNIETIARLEQSLLDERAWDDKVIDAISAIFGHKTFAYLNAFLFALWIWGNVSLKKQAIDPYPFPFLTLIVSLEAIFLSIFILITQNRQNALSERRAHIDLQLNLLDEQESTAQLKILLRISRHLGVDLDDLPEEMTQAIDMDEMVGVLDEAFRNRRKFAS